VWKGLDMVIEPGILTRLLREIDRLGALYFVLLDPDGAGPDENARLAESAARAGADAILVGGSLSLRSRMAETIRAVKGAVDLPVIIFPGNVGFVAPGADAVLFLSLVSGRNPELLIGEHVKAAPLVRELGIEPIPTAYMLVESGATTSVEFMSGTRPLPRNKPDIAMAHALAAQYLGMRIAFLDAGSGADRPVPVEMVSAVSRFVTIPVMVGGGIRTPEAARELVCAGAKIVVTGDVIERTGNAGLLVAFADAVHAV
jgi:phosphoglycerol geranylgeranyltransferase